MACALASPCTGAVTRDVSLLRYRASKAPPRSVAAQAECGQALDAARLRDSIVVAGGGPAGLAAAVALQRVGLPAVVLERGAALDEGGTALGLWTNAWRALDSMGAGDAVRREHPAIDRVELCREDGRQLQEFPLSDCAGGPHEFRGVRRSALLRALHAQLAPGSVLYNLEAAAAETLPCGAAVRLLGGERIECLAVVGADGARSAVGTSIGRGPPNFVGQTAIRGIAPYPEGVPLRAIRQVWGQGVRAGMYPVTDTELYWFVCYDQSPDSGGPGTPAELQAAALRMVQGWGANVLDAVQRTPAEAMARSRIADRWDLLGSPGRCVTLVGDALHPMTPNLGQGGCTALEDAVVLARALRKEGAPALAEDSRRGADGARVALAGAVRSAVRSYERERVARCLPLTVRAHAMGVVLQLPQARVVAARDFFVERFFRAGHFLDHADYDCGQL